MRYGKCTTRVLGDRTLERDAAVFISVLLVASTGLLASEAQSPWATLFAAPPVLAAFHSRRRAMWAAAISVALYTAVSAAGRPGGAMGWLWIILQALLIFGLTDAVHRAAHRRLHRLRRRDEADTAERASLDVQHMINTAYDTEVTLDLVILKQREVLKADSYAVLLTENNVLRPRVSAGMSTEDRSLRIGIHDDDHGWTPAGGAPLVVADTLHTDTRLSGIDPSARSILAVPLHSVERLVGLLFFGSHQPDAFPLEVIDRAETFANRIVFPIQRALLEEELRRLAFTDAQTNLFNHRHFQTLLEEEVRRAQRYGRPLSLVFLDLDDFKGYNDRFGHPAGDALLRELSATLRANLRSVDMAARYGGEEFVIILPETTGEHAELLAERIRAAVEDMEVCPTPEQARRVTVSVGVASFPAHAQSKTELIEAADRAHYEAKRDGKNRVVLARG